MKGRPPKSTAEHQKAGTLNVTRHANRLQPPLLDTVPPAPEGFTQAQKDKWATICRTMIRDGILSDTYLHAIEHYCNAWKRWSEAAAEVDKTGLTFTTDTGQTKSNPAMQIEKEMLSLMMRILEQCGYTPRAAMSIKVTGDGKKDNDPFAEFLNN